MGTDDRQIVLSREELYERVWSTPMRRLAGEFGLSDVSLAKICRRHEIPGYRREDLVDMIQYYHIYAQVPEFIELSERKNYDVDRVAQEIFDRSLGGAEKVKFLKDSWNEGEKPWRAFFNFDEKTFLNEVNAGLQRIENPELFAAPSQVSKVRYPLESLEKFTLGELRETHPEEYQRLRDAVYENHRDDQGNYICARTGWKSKNPYDFEIDHIVPYSKGGLTREDNLQLLRRRENRRKGNRA